METENLSAAAGFLIKVDLFCSAAHSHTTMSCVSVAHQSPRRLPPGEWAWIQKPFLLLQAIKRRYLSAVHYTLRRRHFVSHRSAPSVYSPRFPSHYFTLKYIPVFCITDMMRSGCCSVLLSGVVGDHMRWGPWQARFCVPALSSKAVCRLCVAATPDFVFALKFLVIKCTKSIWCISLQSIINEHFQIWASSKKRKKNALRHQTTYFFCHFFNPSPSH